MKNYHHFSQGQRYQLEVLLKASTAQKEIALLLGDPRARYVGSGSATLIGEMALTGLLLHKEGPKSVSRKRGMPASVYSRSTGIRREALGNGSKPRANRRSRS